MPDLKLTGKLHKILETNAISDSFKKRDFVIETEDQYPQMVKFELTQDNCPKIDEYKVGQYITVHFNVRGREWTNKNNEVVYFVSLNAWRMEREGNNTATIAQKPVETAHEAEDNESLPF